MRIRKHARVSVPPISPSSTTPSTDVCEFNRSPWDVLSEHPQSKLEHQVEIANENYSHNGGGKESPSYAPDSFDALKKQSMEEVGKQVKKVVVKEDKERRLSLVDIVKGKGKKRVNKVKRDMDNYRKCNKNDGKKWHCKNMAKEGYVFCEHHLTKHKFYNDNHSRRRETKCPQTKYPQRSVKKAKAATTSPTEFYYYSGFGPWWGRKRGGSEIKKIELSVIDAADQATSSSTSSPVHVQYHHDENDCMPDYFDFDDEESSEEEEQKMSKRRPRPIKARSLKSLL